MQNQVKDRIQILANLFTMHDTEHGMMAMMIITIPEEHCQWFAALHRQPRVERVRVHAPCRRAAWPPRLQEIWPQSPDGFCGRIRANESSQKIDHSRCVPAIVEYLNLFAKLFVLQQQILTQARFFLVKRFGGKLLKKENKQIIRSTISKTSMLPDLTNNKLRNMTAASNMPLKMWS